MSTEANDIAKDCEKVHVNRSASDWCRKVSGTLNDALHVQISNTLFCLSENGGKMNALKRIFENDTLWSSQQTGLFSFRQFCS